MTEVRTPNGTQIVAVNTADNTVTDITEAVMAMYDLVIGGMDWGSGFWTADDAMPVARAARICGFAQAEEAERYVRNKEEAEERMAFLAQLVVKHKVSSWHKLPLEHEHIFSTKSGKCMWPRCTGGAEQPHKEN